MLDPVDSLYYYQYSGHSASPSAKFDCVDELHLLTIRISNAIKGWLGPHYRKAEKWA
jgi:hypothetical protein